jgi:hypothetical protein
MQATSLTGSLSRKWLLLTISLIVLSTVLFVTGVLIERSGGAASTATSIHQNATQPPVTSGDPDGGHEATPSNRSQGAPTNVSPAGGADERVFGLDLENPWFVGAFVLVWLVLIAALVRLGRIAWLALLLLASVAAVLDGGEVIRKVGEANTLLATFAMLVGVAHVALAALALFALSTRWRTMA